MTATATVAAQPPHACPKRRVHGYSLRAGRPTHNEEQARTEHRVPGGWHNECNGVSYSHSVPHKFWRSPSALP
jgi:hypothetical protein